MSTNYKSALALIAAALVSANLSPAGEGAQPRDEGGPPSKFQNLITDDAALEAWLAIGPAQPEIILEGTPLSEVAGNTARIFKNQFDLILPSAAPTLSPMAVQMRLKDVRAIEVFNAMNLYFEVQKLPARWKLTLNGSRPTAILEMERLPAAAMPPAETEKIGQTVFPIPDILCASSPASDKQTADNLEETVAAALDDLQKPGHAKVNAPGGPIIKVHAPAGILVFSGTWEETELVRSTLQALKDTAQERKAAALDRELRAKDEAARKEAEDLKNGCSGNLKK
jgi:hypothetical protein